MPDLQHGGNMIRQTAYYLAEQTNPYRNLAVEEFLLNTVKDEECILYLWQNLHTVVIGRNQNCWQECKVAKLQEEDGFLARRLSGGGAVYHDLGNLNFTFLIRKADYDISRQLNVIIEAVRSFGIDAVQTGRNDITVDGRKFSGNAFYENGDHCYHHGTIMVNVNMEYLPRYLNVSLKKMQSKGVSSVRSRVINLADCNPEITIDSMKSALIEAFGKVYGHTPSRIDEQSFNDEEIKKLTQKFTSNSWRLGQQIPFTCAMEERYPWGTITLQYEVKDGRVTECRAYSDAMDAEFIPLIEKNLNGAAFGAPDMCARLTHIAAETKLQEQILQDTVKLIQASI